MNRKAALRLIFPNLSLVQFTGPGAFRNCSPSLASFLAEGLIEDDLQEEANVHLLYDFAEDMRDELVYFPLRIPASTRLSSVSFIQILCRRLYLAPDPHASRSCLTMLVLLPMLSPPEAGIHF